jgi:peptidyl-prolyl cis-trans isomerase A (cyclophilin A)
MSLRRVRRTPVMSPAILALAVGLVSMAARGRASAAAGQLRNPASRADRAPDVFRTRFETSKGAFVIEVHRAWAPIGADRFYDLVKNGFYDDCRFFRVIDGLMAQIGINGNPTVQSVWADARIPDDPVRQSNKPGYVTLAHAGSNTRATQFFINLTDNSALLDRKGFAPIGRVLSGLDVVEQLYSGYGDGAPRGIGPSQMQIASEGNAFLKKKFPKLDYVRTATVEK